MTLLDTMNERFNNDTTVYNLIFEEDAIVLPAKFLSNQFSPTIKIYPKVYYRTVTLRKICREIIVNQ